MRFEVPQFIEIEDKIIGPLTWKQFVYLGGGAGLLVILYLSFSFFLFILIGVPVGALAASLAFQRVNNRPFSAFLEGFIGYIRRSKLYLWKRETEQEVVVRTEVVTNESAQPIERRPRLSTLSKKIEFENPS